MNCGVKMDDNEIYHSLLSINDEDMEFACEYFEELGFHLPADGKVAFEKCMQGANDNIQEMQYILAKFYQVGLFCNEDKEAAFFWCDKAVKNEYLPAFKLLAGFYEMGWGGVEKDEKKAFDLIKEAADKGSVSAMKSLSNLYATGHMINEDKEAAIYYMKKASDLGDEEAQESLLRMLKDRQ